MNTPDITWFRKDHYGMFIHWGLYALPGGYWKGQHAPFGTEWIMRNLKIPYAEYSQLAAQFDPVDFDADRWVLDAKRCGMKYMVFTAKHHDGFCMYHTKVSKYNIVDATPFGRDVVKELSEACARHGLRFGVYYSQFQDWEDPNADGNTWDFPAEGRNFRQYFDNKVIPQVTELLENYGKISIIWFDTPYNMGREYCEELKALVRRLQPECLINGRIGYKMGDYQQMGDNGIPRHRFPGAWETPMTLNDTWGYSKTDENWKPASKVVTMLTDIVEGGGNFLINVGPDEKGNFPAGGMKCLESAGKWLEVYGDSIFGCESAPEFPYQLHWGGFTYKPGKLYMHVRQWPTFPYEICVVGLVTKVLSGRMLHDGSPVGITQSYEIARDEYRLRVQLPEKPVDPLDTVIELTLEGAPEIHHA